MSEETTPQPDPIPEVEVAQRSLTAAIVEGALVGGGALLGPPAAVALDHFLGGGNAEPPSPEVELPLGVHVDDD